MMGNQEKLLNAWNYFQETLRILGDEPETIFYAESYGKGLSRKNIDATVETAIKEFETILRNEVQKHMI